jgi:hypothetical protein
VEKIDFTRLITKQVVSSDKKSVGRVDGLDDRYLIVKDRLFNPRYYKIPREKVNRYHAGEVLLDISEQDRPGCIRPGYFKDDSD